MGKSTDVLENIAGSRVVLALIEQCQLALVSKSQFFYFKFKKSLASMAPNLHVFVKRNEALRPVKRALICYLSKHTATAVIHGHINNCMILHHKEGPRKSG